MLKFCLSLGLQAIACSCFYAATTIAPDMTWPHTAADHQAAALLVLGAVLQVAGAIAGCSLCAKEA